MQKLLGKDLQMIQNPKYKAAFQAGYNQGLEAGLDGSMAKLVMTHDLIFVYGTMALCLFENHHWKKETIEKLILEIQNQWHSLNRENPDDTMMKLVEKRTGISLDQMVQDIISV